MSFAALLNLAVVRLNYPFHATPPVSTLFATGRIVDLILAFTAIEAACLVAWHRRAGRGPAPADLSATSCRACA